MCLSKGRLWRETTFLDFLFWLFFSPIEWSVLWSSGVLCHFRWCCMWQNRPHSHFLWDNLLRLCSVGEFVEESLQEWAKGFSAPVARCSLFRAHGSDFVLCFLLLKHLACAPFCENKGFLQLILTKPAWGGQELITSSLWKHRAGYSLPSLRWWPLFRSI